MLAGRDLLNRFKWKVGDTVTLLGGSVSQDFAVTIAGVIDFPMLADNFVMHDAYFQALRKQAGGVNLFFFRVTDQSHVDQVRQAISGWLAGQPTQTEVISVSQYVASKVAQAREVSALVLGLVIVVSLATMLVVGNTMAISARERGHDIAILRSLGFGRAHVLRLVLGEAVAVAAAGSLIGGLGAYALFHLAGFSLPLGLQSYFSVGAATVLESLAVGVTMGLLAGLPSALSATRVDVVSVMRGVHCTSLPLSYHLQNLRVRRLTTALTLAGLALVIFVFVIVMGLAQGLTHLFVSTGAHDNLLFIRKGASTLAVSSLTEDVLPAVRYLPEVKRGAQGEPLVSAELIENLSIPTGHEESFLLDARTPPTSIMADIRGVDLPAYQIHRAIRMVEGRRPAAGAAEVMVGRGLARQMRNVSVGFHAHARTWDPDDSLGFFELRRQRRRVGDLGRPLRADGRPDASDSSFIVRDRRPTDRGGHGGAGARVETNFNSRRPFAWSPNAGNTRPSQASNAIRAAAVMLVGLMAIGMVFSGMNTTYTLIAARRREIGALRAIGFSRDPCSSAFSSRPRRRGAAGGLLGGLPGLLLNGLPFDYDGKRPTSESIPRSSCWALRWPW